jgi:hypothetical protein
MNSVGPLSAATLCQTGKEDETKMAELRLLRTMMPTSEERPGFGDLPRRPNWALAEYIHDRMP